MLLDVIQAAHRRPSSTTAKFAHLGALGLFFFAILDSSPIPTFGGADILTVILVVTRPHPWYEYAAAATAGSVVGAYITFRLARRAGQHYLENKVGKRRVSRFLKFFETWGTVALIAVTAIPFPMPTSLMFAAAGASNEYSTRKYLSVVVLSRAARYSCVALIAHIYGRHIIRVLRHPAQNWHWLLLFGFIFVGVVSIGILVSKRFAQSAESDRSVEASA
jgi:membrane protein YqaA with SNARE-associated domain